MRIRQLRAMSFACLCLLVACENYPAAAGEEVKLKLKNGSEFSGTLLRRNNDGVIFMLPYGEVESIDGQPLPAAVTAGAAAPAFTAADLSGVQHAIPAKAGGATLLQFWATWCPHCRSDMPLLQDLHARYHERGLQIIGVSIDTNADAVRSFVHDKRLAFPVIAALEHLQETNIDLSDLYQADGVPAYFLIDATGTIARTFSGSVTEGGRVDLEGAIQHLLAGAEPVSQTAASSSTSTPPARASTQQPARKRRWLW